MAEVKDVTEEKEEKSLSETLAESFEAAEEAAEEEYGEEEEEESESEEEEESSGVEEGQEEAVEEAAGEGGEEVEAEPLKWERGNLAPQQHWTQQDKEAFTRLPREAQELILKKDREFQSDYTRKMQGIAEVKRALEPVRTTLEQVGITEGDAVRRLVGAHLMLVQNPAQGIRYVAEQYGIDLNNLGAGQSQEESAALREVNSIRQQLFEQQRAALASRVQSYEKEIEEVRKDAPFFDEVEADMERLARSYIASNIQPPSVRDLYNEAVWANPTVREKALAARQAEAEKKRLESEKARVRKAKKAVNSQVRSTSTGEEKSKSKPKSLHDEISEIYAKAEQG